MPDLTMTEMLDMQKDLWEKHRDSWSPMEPEYGRNFILWMVEELGEVISIIKKKGDSAVMDDLNVRHAFTEEMADVLMYYHEILLRYHISAEEIAAVYREKHQRNLERDYDAQYSKLYAEQD